MGRFRFAGEMGRAAKDRCGGWYGAAWWSGIASALSIPAPQPPYWVRKAASSAAVGVVVGGVVGRGRRRGRRRRAAAAVRVVGVGGGRKRPQRTTTWGYGLRVTSECAASVGAYL